MWHWAAEAEAGQGREEVEVRVVSNRRRHTNSPRVLTTSMSEQVGLRAYLREVEGREATQHWGTAQIWFQQRGAVVEAHLLV
jgi:hypothetical protein